MSLETRLVTNIRIKMVAINLATLFLQIWNTVGEFWGRVTRDFSSFPSPSEKNKV